MCDTLLFKERVKPLLGKRLRIAREEKGLTQADVAKLLNISASAVGMYEQGRRDPDTDTLRKFAELYKLPTDHLLGTDEIKEGFVNALKGKFTPTFSEKLKLSRRKAGITQEQVAIKMGLSVGTISGYERGYRKPEPEILKDLADLYGVTTDFILSDQDRVPFEAIPLKANNLHMIPVIGRVSAGNGVYAEEDIEEYWPIDISITNLYGHDLNQYFFLRVKGDSMTPLINDGDLVLVWKGNVEDGDIAVVVVERSEGCVKKIQFQTFNDKAYITLISRNPNYQPKTYPVEDCFIAGKVVWRSGDVRW